MKFQKINIKKKKKSGIENACSIWAIKAAEQTVKVRFINCLP